MLRDAESLLLSAMPRAAAPSKLALHGIRVRWFVWVWGIFFPNGGVLDGFVTQLELRRALCLVTAVSVTALGCARVAGAGGLRGEQPGTATSSLSRSPGKKAGLWELLAPTAFQLSYGKLLALAQYSKFSSECKDWHRERKGPLAKHERLSCTHRAANVYFECDT